MSSHPKRKYKLFLSLTARVFIAFQVWFSTQSHKWTLINTCTFHIFQMFHTIIPLFQSWIQYYRSEDKNNICIHTWTHPLFLEDFWVGRRAINLPIYVYLSRVNWEQMFITPNEVHIWQLSGEFCSVGTALDLKNMSCFDLVCLALFLYVSPEFPSRLTLIHWWLSSILSYAA
jgi:hypothetical protein